MDIYLTVVAWINCILKYVRKYMLNSLYYPFLTVPM